MSTATWILFVTGALTTLAAVPLLLRTVQLLRVGRRTQGVVTDLDADSSGTFQAIVSFTPDEPPATADGRITFRASGPRTNTKPYSIGQPVAVLYHPASPHRAVIPHGLQLWGFSVSLLAMAGVQWAIAGALWLIPALVNAEASRQAALEFVVQVRRLDAEQLRSVAAPGAQLDEAFLAEFVKPSTDFIPGNSARGWKTACLRGVTMPVKRELYLYLEKSGETWQVVRAGPVDPECEERVEYDP